MFTIYYETQVGLEYTTHEYEFSIDEFGPNFVGGERNNDTVSNKKFLKILQDIEIEQKAGCLVCLEVYFE